MTVMTDDEVVALAIQAGATKNTDNPADREFFCNFARLIAEKQKEIDAGICDKAAYSSATEGFVTVFMECAAAIRSQK